MNFRISHSLCSGILAAALCATACGDDGNNDGISTRNDGGTPARDAGNIDGSVDGGIDASIGTPGGDSGLLDGGEVSVNDAQIAGILAAVNSAEISQGQAASTKATNVSVKDYANMMVQMHTDAQTMETALLSTLGLTPADSAVTVMLMGVATQNSAKLSALSAGEAYDFAYISVQAEQHQTVLDLIEQTLLPQVQNAQLKTFLQTTRTTVASHLAEAKALAADYHVGGDGGVTGGPDGGLGDAGL